MTHYHLYPLISETLNRVAQDSRLTEQQLDHIIHDYEVMLRMLNAHGSLGEDQIARIKNRARDYGVNPKLMMGIGI